jgi:hypothetical protein
MTEKNTPEPTPTLLALELRGFAAGVESLAAQLEIGNMKDATKEQRHAAENAALALLRNAPLAIRSIRRLEGFAEATAERATKNRDAIMTSMFGPDTA